MLSRKLLPSVALYFVFSRLLCAQCGGEERWSVKVGGDSRANEVDLAHPVQISLHDLAKVTRPTGIGKDTPRTDSELKVYILEARLLKFKRETGKTGDDDYHLVITDDTLKFSPGGPHTTASQHSVIAEVVNPDCIAGRKGDQPTPVSSNPRSQPYDSSSRLSSRIRQI